MPYAEYGSGQSCQRIGGKVSRSQRNSQTAVLHTDLNGYGRSLGIFHLEGFGRTKAQSHSKYVMYGYHTKHLKSACKYFVGVNSHYTGNNHNYGYYRYEGEYARYLIYVLSEKSFYKYSQKHRHEYYLNDRYYHGHKGYLNPCSCQ